LKWRQHSWFHRLAGAVSDTLRAVGPNANLVLVDGGEWDATDAFGSRAVRPFIERGGLDWGPPPDGEFAIEQLEIVRREGTQYFVIGWNCFWWFDAYPSFAEHLERTANCLLRNENVAIFRLNPFTASTLNVGALSFHLSKSA